MKAAAHPARETSGGERPSGRRSVAPALFAGAGIGLAAAVFLIFAAGPGGPVDDFPGPFAAAADASWPAGARPAPDFTLQNQDGDSVSLSSLRGRVVLLTFLDSRCTHLCRIEGPLLGGVQGALRDAERPVIVAVSVNPKDTPESVRAAARDWDWWQTDWHWLMGEPEQLAGVWAAYGVDVQRIPDDLLHSGVLYVIDRAGDERGGYATPFDRERVTRLVRSLSGTTS